MEFLHLLEKKNLDFLETYPTFISSPILMPSGALQTLKHTFLWHPVVIISVFK